MAIQTAPPSSSGYNAPTTNGAAGSASAGASEKTLLVLEAALTHSRFTEVVEATGLAKATTHRILGTLVDRQFITVDADGNYLPGPKILSLAGMALQRIDISAIARPFVDELVAKTHCTVHLGVVNGDEIIYLVRADSDRPYVMPSRVGLAIPMHSTGIGKVVLGSWLRTSWSASSHEPACRPGRSTRSPRCRGCAPRSRTCAGWATPSTVRRTWPAWAASRHPSGTTPAPSHTASASRPCSSSTPSSRSRPCRPWPLRLPTRSPPPLVTGPDPGPPVHDLSSHRRFTPELAAQARPIGSITK